MKITVIRIGHRKERDKRVSSHCFLVARALGAQRGVLCGEEDARLLESVKSVVKNWGGNFNITYSPSWKKALSAAKRQGFTLVHATMYGEPVEEKAPLLSRKRKIAIVVGAEKVPAEVYQLCDHNVSVTAQPHSEIAALALLLDRLQPRAAMTHKFARAKITITPQARGKKVTKRAKQKTDF
jgi:tRNA (cytidine56-2'-O)-methyltransferase